MRLPLFIAALMLGALGVTSAGQLPRRSPDTSPGTVEPGAATRPRLPAAHVETAVVPSSGRTRTVLAGGDLQAAFDAVEPGDTIAIEAGVVFRGPFTLSGRAGRGTAPGIITVTTTAPPEALPPEGTRIGPSFAGQLPVIESGGARPALIIPPGVGGYRFVGVEIRSQSGAFAADLVTITSAPGPAVTASIVFDRCYVHGDPTVGARRGIAMNGGATAVIDSYFADFKDPVNDSQALAGWAGPGPFAILNNHLEAAGENVLFGGADPTTPGLVPSDIEIRHNHFTKPLTWKVDDPAHDGRRWSVKNLLELKNAQRVLIDGNVFEYAWRAAQSGFAILFTVRNQDGRAPWSVVSDVTFTNNIVRHATSGINILGRDDIRTSQRTQRIVIGNNLFEDISGVWGTGRLFQMLNGAEDVIFEHNTAAAQTDSFLMGGDTLPHPRLVFVDNIVPHNLYGLFGSSTSVGLASMEHYFPGARFARNVIVGGNTARYPLEQYFPGTYADVGFTDLAGGNYRLRADSPYRNVATDGTGAGVDYAQLLAATAGADTAAARMIPQEPDVPVDAPVQAALVSWLGVGPWNGAWSVLWISAGLLVWTYAGYPGFIAAWGWFRPRPIRRQRIQPPVSVLVIANNEESAIAARIQDLLRLDYPTGRLDIVIASDGSTDRTVALARAGHSPRIRVASFGERRGKAAILNELVPQLTGAIVVLTDTRQRIETGAITALVAPFADATVGAVSGELMLDDSGSGALGGVGGYWRYEKLIRRGESAVDSSIGATGALYAIRRSLFEPIPPDTILDDVLIPLRIARRGYRIVFEPAARAYDRVSATAYGEFARKVRTCAGNVQLLARERWLLLPWRNRLWFQTLSHKGLRLMLPFLHVLTLGSSLILVRESPVAAALVLGQGLFLTLALLGATSGRGARWLGALASAPYAICLLNCATVAGIGRFLRGSQAATWERAPARAPLAFPRRTPVAASTSDRVPPQR